MLLKAALCALPAFALAVASSSVHASKMDIDTSEMCINSDIPSFKAVGKPCVTAGYATYYTSSIMPYHRDMHKVMLSSNDDEFFAFTAVPLLQSIISVCKLQLNLGSNAELKAFAAQYLDYAFEITQHITYLQDVNVHHFYARSEDKPTLEEYIDKLATFDSKITNVHMTTKAMFKSDMCLDELVINALTLHTKLAVEISDKICSSDHIDDIATFAQDLRAQGKKFLEDLETLEKQYVIANS